VILEVVRRSVGDGPVDARAIATNAFAATGEAAPRTIALVTGASGTTDIEASYVRGAHGPRFLHVVLIMRGGPP
jgi:L-lactate utilization protein LutC